MSSQHLLSPIISLIALLLGIFNFIVTARSNRRNKRIQNRNDRIQVDNLLDTAYECLYGRNGYVNTKERHRYHEAESHILRAKEIDNKYSRVIEYEGMCIEQEGNKIKAIEKYNEALKLKPLRWNTYNNLGRLSEGEKAILYYQQAIKVNPDKAGIPFYNIGMEYLKLNETTKAKDSFLKSLEYLPKYQLSHFQLAQIFRKTDNYKEARVSYEKAISCNPKYIDAMVNLGAMLCEKIDWEEGVAWIEQAMKVDPMDDYPYAMLAALFADKGDAENALKYNEKAIELDLTRRISGDVSQDLKKAMTDLKGVQKKI